MRQQRRQACMRKGGVGGAGAHLEGGHRVHLAELEEVDALQFRQQVRQVAAQPSHLQPKAAKVALASARCRHIRHHLRIDSLRQRAASLVSRLLRQSLPQHIQLQLRPYRLRLLCRALPPQSPDDAQMTVGRLACAELSLALSTVLCSHMWNRSKSMLTAAPRGASLRRFSACPTHGSSTRMFPSAKLAAGRRPDPPVQPIVRDLV